MPRAAAAALTLALALAACGRPPATVQPVPTDDSTARPAFVTTPGSLASAEAVPFSSAPTSSWGFKPEYVLRAMAFQDDGRMIAAGRSPSGNFYLARYLTDGSLDPSFSADGKVTTDFAGSAEAVNAVRVQPDGKVVAVGYSTAPDGSSRVAIARYNVDGSLDGSFEGGGKRVTTVSGVGSRGNAVTFQTLGGQLKIVVGGETSGSSTIRRQYLAVRYNANGSLDTGFSGDGIATANPSRSGVGYAVAVQTDGKVVVGGTTQYSSSPDRCYTDGSCAETFGLVRFNANGSLDAGFRAAIITTGYDGHRVNALAVQPDGKIVAAGRLFDQFSVARYNPNGSLEGYRVLDQFPDNRPGTNGPGSAEDVTLQPDGKIVVAGYNRADFGTESNITYHPWFALARLNPDFSLDSSFGSGGLVTTDSGGPNGTDDVALRVRLRAGKIVAAGFSSSSGGTDFAFARYYQ